MLYTTAAFQLVTHLSWPLPFDYVDHFSQFMELCSPPAVPWWTVHDACLHVTAGVSFAHFPCWRPFGSAGFQIDWRPSGFKSRTSPNAWNHRFPPAAGTCCQDLESFLLPSRWRARRAEHMPSQDPALCLADGWKDFPDHCLAAWAIQHSSTYRGHSTQIIWAANSTASNLILLMPKSFWRLNTANFTGHWNLAWNKPWESHTLHWHPLINLNFEVAK